MIVWLTNRHHNPLTISEIKKLTLTQIVSIYASVERDDKGNLELKLNSPGSVSRYKMYEKFCIMNGIGDVKLIKKLYKLKMDKKNGVGKPTKSS